MIECNGMSGTLYSVATPIGNLEDITYRAVRVLGTVSAIICEDTRETAKVLSHYGVTGKSLVSYHAQSAPRVEDGIIERLLGGEDLALVTDRGTPGISDPGARLVTRCVAEGIVVVPVPGSSAVIAALQGAGVDTSSFLYLGFLPHKKGRQTLLTMIATEERTVVFYESPHRVLKTLDALAACGRAVVVCRELTKVHEEFLRGTASQVAALLRERGEVKGECVVIVHGPAHLTGL